MAKPVSRRRDSAREGVFCLLKYAGPVGVRDFDTREIWKRFIVLYPHLKKFMATVRKEAGAMPKIKRTKTNRGFALGKFTDRYGVKCSIQKSSLATEDAIWLGCEDADPRMLVPGHGWQPVNMPDEYIANTRMHLTRKHVLALLPLLEHFVETGELPAPARKARREP